MNHCTLVRHSSLVSVRAAYRFSTREKSFISRIVSSCQSIVSNVNNPRGKSISSAEPLKCLRHCCSAVRLRVLTSDTTRQDFTHPEFLSSDWHRTQTRPFCWRGFDKRTSWKGSGERRSTCRPPCSVVIPGEVAFTVAECALFIQRSPARTCSPLTGGGILKEPALPTCGLLNSSQPFDDRLAERTRPETQVTSGAPGLVEEFALVINTFSTEAGLTKKQRRTPFVGGGQLQNQKRAVYKLSSNRQGQTLGVKRRHLAVSRRQFHVCSRLEMAKSKFEYVRQFEADDPCLPNCWIVVRIDGKAFHKFTDTHHYMKPNDERGLSLMTRAAQTVMSEFNEIVLSYGQSDEYSFVFHKTCKLYNRRASKIMTNVVSLFASSFTLFWPRFFNSQELQYPPSFDGRVVMYPSDENLRDYLSWRQADCHINNLYNTCFWKLVQEKGLTPNRAADRLKGTLSSDKNELLFSEFNINYNNLPELFRKGSVLIRPKSIDSESPSPERSINNHHVRGHEGKASKKPGSIVLHTDIIGKQFWEENPQVLNPKV